MSSNKDRGPLSRNYRKPPAEYQFKKGTSGNPTGRPKKKEATPSLIKGGISDRLAAVALEEATRLVLVREGDKVSELPAMQAMLRTLIRSGAQGDIKAARQVLELITRAEAARVAISLGFLEKALEYKKEMGPIFEQCDRDGVKPPEIYPHPDDVLINQSTGEVSIDGPISKEEAAARKAAQEHAPAWERRLRKVATKLDKDPKNRELRREFNELKDMFDFIESDIRRLNRHALLRVGRYIHDPKQPQPPTDDTTDEPDE